MLFNTLSNIKSYYCTTPAVNVRAQSITGLPIAQFTKPVPESAEPEPTTAYKI